MDKSFLEQITITVAKRTAEDLRKLSADAEISVGEVVDRLTERMATTDPDIAIQIIVEDLIIVTSKLSEEDHGKVMEEFAKKILMLCSPESAEELIRAAGKEREETIVKLASLSGEEFTDLER